MGQQYVRPLVVMVRVRELMAENLIQINSLLNTAGPTIPSILSHNFWKTAFDMQKIMKELLLCQSFAEQTPFLLMICLPEFSAEPIDVTT
jgi:hypothetical protein